MRVCPLCLDRSHLDWKGLIKCSLMEVAERRLRMRRILLLLAVALVMAAMVAVVAVPAFASQRGGQGGKGGVSCEAQIKNKPNVIPLLECIGI
jgi:hypothetical protein